MKLQDFLKVSKVRCVNIGGHVYIAAGKEYDVVGLDEDSVYIVNDDHEEYDYLYKYFEPVLDPAENPPQGMELTPEFEATDTDVSEFKAGDKVYAPSLTRMDLTSDLCNNCGLSSISASRFFIQASANDFLLKVFDSLNFGIPSLVMRISAR